jgi:HD-GYP domain-containing protein (c-di-GMP phosphodiesterase class II)
MKKRKLHFSQKLTLIFTFVSLIGIITTGSITYQIGKNIIKKLVNVHIEHTSTLIYRMAHKDQELVIDSIINERIGSILKANLENHKSYHKGIIDEKSYFSSLQSYVLSESLLKNSSSTSIIVVDSNQNIRVNPPVSLSNSARNFILKKSREAKESEKHSARARLGDYIDGKSISEVRYFPTWNMTIWFTISRNKLNYLINPDTYKEIFSELPNDSLIRSFIINSQGVVLIGNIPARIYTQGNDYINKIIKKKKGSLSYNVREFIPLSGKYEVHSKTAYFHYLEDLDWILVSEANMDQAYYPLAILQKVIIVVCLYATAIVILISLFMGKRVSTPLHKINQATRNITRTGNLSQKIEIFQEDEFGELAHSFNLMLDSIKTTNNRLLKTQEITITTLAAIAETRDPETGNHVKRTQAYVKLLGEKLFENDKYKTLLSNDFIRLLYISSPLHDIGKVGVPDNILLKPGKLTESEFEEMKMHTFYGKQALEHDEISEDNRFLDIAKEIALSHHERWDGSGYPEGLKGDEIPLSARIMAVADVYDALRNERVYKGSYTHNEAVDIIVNGRGNHFDPDIVDAFLEVSEQFKSISEIIHI